MKIGDRGDSQSDWEVICMPYQNYEYYVSVHFVPSYWNSKYDAEQMLKIDKGDYTDDDFSADVRFTVDDEYKVQQKIDEEFTDRDWHVNVMTGGNLLWIIVNRIEEDDKPVLVKSVEYDDGTGCYEVIFSVALEAQDY